jgi:hypothetical protein
VQSARQPARPSPTCKGGARGGWRRRTRRAADANPPLPLSGVLSPESAQRVACFGMFWHVFMVFFCPHSPSPVKPPSLPGRAIRRGRNGQPEPAQASVMGRSAAADRPRCPNACGPLKTVRHPRHRRQGKRTHANRLRRDHPECCVICVIASRKTNPGEHSALRPARKPCVICVIASCRSEPARQSPSCAQKIKDRDRRY